MQYKCIPVIPEAEALRTIACVLYNKLLFILLYSPSSWSVSRETGQGRVSLAPHITLPASYHFVELWAVWAIVLEILHSLLNLGHARQVLFQPTCGAGKERSRVSLRGRKMKRRTTGTAFGRGKKRINTAAQTYEYSTPPFQGPGTPVQEALRMRPSGPSSPLPDDLLCVTGHVVVADDVVQAGQSLLNVLLQPLQVLCLLVHRDDGVLQLHQAALKGRQDRHLRGGTPGSQASWLSQSCS